MPDQHHFKNRREYLKYYKEYRKKHRYEISETKKKYREKLKSKRAIGRHDTIYPIIHWKEIKPTEEDLEAERKEREGPYEYLLKERKCEAKSYKDYLKKAGLVLRRSEGVIIIKKTK